MGSRASIAKHPFHPMLIVFPIGLWVFSFVCDIIYFSGGPPVWSDLAYYSMAGGLIGALAAAVPGFIDLYSLPRKMDRARKVGLWHMGINLFIVAVYAVNLYIRNVSPPEATLPFVLSVFGVALLTVSGWLGGELVYVEGVAVEGTNVRGEAETPEKFGKKAA